jgi:hypothetical protein
VGESLGDRIIVTGRVIDEYVMVWSDHFSTWRRRTSSKKLSRICSYFFVTLPPFPRPLLSRATARLSKYP